MQEIQRTLCNLYLIDGKIPDADEIIKWYDATLKHIDGRFDDKPLIEWAGDMAAQEVFGKYFKHDGYTLNSATQSTMVLLQTLSEILNGK